MARRFRRQRRAAAWQRSLRAQTRPQIPKRRGPLTGSWAQQTAAHCNGQRTRGRVRRVRNLSASADCDQGPTGACCTDRHARGCVGGRVRKARATSGLVWQAAARGSSWHARKRIRKRQAARTSLRDRQPCLDIGSMRHQIGARASAPACAAPLRSCSHDRRPGPGLVATGSGRFLIIELVQNNFGLFKFELNFQNLVENKVKSKL